MSPPLRIAVLHYHLRRGGVSQVVRHARDALPRDRFRLAAIVGEPADPIEDLAFATVPGLTYGADSDHPQSLLAEIRSTAEDLLGGPPDIWHVHNHSLGKNLTMPGLVAQLSAAGERILLQPHDFAEDCRPANYRYLDQGLPPADFARLYPCSARIHYALLTRRDRDLLAKSGAPAASLHILPNPAPPAPSAEDGEDAEREQPPRGMILYPSRAIRRKNLGELLLWASLDREGHRYGVTLAPRNPREQPLYQRWTALARGLGLPVDFELGHKYGFADLLAAASAAISCSLAEGYGLAFVEPWMSGCPLLGRDLPEITSGFDRFGMDLEHCYSRFDIPVDILGREQVESRLRQARESMLRQYRRQAGRDDGERVLAAAIEDGMVDFGTLDERLQSELLRTLARSENLRKELGVQLPIADAGSKIERNRIAIEGHLSLDEYGRMLARIYHELMDAPGEQPAHLETGQLLEQFLAPSRFRALLASS